MKEELLTGYDWTKFWEDQSPPIIFHGTSSVLLDSILENGLDPKISFIEREAVDELMRFQRALGEEVKEPYYTNIKELSLTFNYGAACKYAHNAPERAKYLLADYKDLLKRIPAGEFPKITSRMEERERRLADLIQNKKPVVIYIQTNLSIFNELPLIFSSREYLEEQVAAIEEASRPGYEYIRPTMREIVDANGDPEATETLGKKMCMNDWYLLRQKFPDLSTRELIGVKVRGWETAKGMDRGPGLEINTKSKIPREDIVHIEYISD